MKCGTPNARLCREDGYILIFSLLVLLVLSVLGVAASNTTSFELRMAANERDYQGTLFAAEAGISHMRQLLANELEDRVTQANASGSTVDLDFALDSSSPMVLTDVSFGNYLYTVKVRNNEADPNNDTDRKVFINSVATLQDGTGAWGARVELEVLVEAEGEGDNLMGYGAQEGGGSGKNYNSTDLEAVQGNAMTSLGQI